MGHIVHLNNGKWKVVFEKRSLDGTRKRGSKTFDANVQKSVLKKYLADQERKYQLSNGTIYSKITVEEFAEIYREQTQYLSPSTQATNYSLLYNKPNGIITNLGKIQLARLKTKEIQVFISGLQGLSSKTKHNYLMLLRSLLNLAKVLGYLEYTENPTDNVIIKRTKPKEIVPYNAKEIRYILDEANKTEDSNLKLILALSCFAGLRRSEQAFLKYENIDFENNCINVVGARVAAGSMGDVIKGTKSVSGERKIYMPKAVIDLLKYEKDKRGCNDSDYVLVDEEGNPVRVYRGCEIISS